MANYDLGTIGYTVVSQGTEKATAGIASLSKQLMAAERQYALLDRAKNRGLISIQQYGRGVQQVDAQIESLTASLDQQNAALTRNSAYIQRSHKSTNRFGMVTQQVGYQVGDFFVQVQSGTDALVAFGQQGTQLAGLLPGLAGAVVGIGLSLATAFLNASLSARKLEFDIKKFGSDLKDALAPIGLLLQPIINAFSEVGRVAGGVLSFLGQNIDSVIVAIGGASLVFAGSLIPAILGTAKAIGTMTLALARNPLFLLGVVLASLAVAFYQVVKAVGSFGGAIDAIGKILGEIFSANNIGALFDWFVNKSKETWLSFKASALEALVSLTVSFGEPFNKIGAIVMGTVSGIKAVFSALPEIIGDAAKSGVNMAIDAFAKMADAALIPINALIRGVNALGGSLSEITVGNSFNGMKFAVGNSGKDLGAVFSQGFATGYNDSLIKKPILDTLKKTQAQAESAAKVAGSAASNALGRLQGSATLSNLVAQITGQEGPFSGDYLTPDGKGSGGGAAGGGGAKTDPIAELEKEINSRLALIGLRGKERWMQEKITELTEKYGEEIKDPSIIKAYTERFYALEKLEQLEEKQLENLQSISDTLETSMSDAFTSMVDGTQTVSEAFKGMAKEIIKQLFDILVVQQIVGSWNPQTGQGGGLVGMLMGSLSSGGSMVAGKPYLVGEKGPELVIPRHSGTVVNAHNTAAIGTAGPVTVQNVITVNGSDKDSVRREIQKMIPQITEATKASVINARQRGGAMKSAFQ